MSRPKKNEGTIIETNADYIVSESNPAADMSATEALVAGIAACGNVQATRVNPHFRSKYFGLGDLLAQVKPTLAAYGLVILQVPYTSEDRISVKTEILHGKSGPRDRRHPRSLRSPRRDRHRAPERAAVRLRRTWHQSGRP